MAREQGFLDAIIDEPDDDTHRLVYADWLEENDNLARAEFIRVGCQIDRLPPGDLVRLCLEDRADDLLAEHEMDWLGPEDLYGWEWRRGFVEKVSAGARSTLEPARAQFERHPVRVAGFGMIRRDLADMIRSPFLERLRKMAFDVGASEENRAILLDLLASPRLAGLTELDVWTGESGGLLADLADQPVIPPLKMTQLDAFTDADVAALLSAANLAGLTDVGAVFSMSSDALAALLSVPDRWTGLDLGFASYELEQVAPLADCVHLRRLKLRWPGDRAVLALPSSLEELTIDPVNNSRPRPGVVARSLARHRLRHLDYCWNPRGVASPESWAGLGELLTALPGPVLDLTLSSFTEDPLVPLVKLPGLANLRRLEVAGCGITNEGVDGLVGCAALTGLRSLEILRDWSTKMIRRFAEAPLLEGLRQLRMQGVPMGDAGVATLVQSPRLRRLRELELMGVGLGRAGVEALADWPGITRLRRLNLNMNRLTADDLRPLQGRYCRRLG